MQIKKLKEIVTIGLFVVLVCTGFFLGRCTTKSYYDAFKQVESDFNAARSTIAELEKNYSLAREKLKSIEKLQRTIVTINNKLQEITGKYRAITGQLEIGNIDAIKIVDEIEAILTE